MQTQPLEGCLHGPGTPLLIPTGTTAAQAFPSQQGIDLFQPFFGALSYAKHFKTSASWLQP